MKINWKKEYFSIADKLIQWVLILGLTFRYPLMSYVLCLFFIKELFITIMGIVMLRRGKKMDGAQRYGKICTTVLYIVMILLILRPDLQLAAANMLMAVCMVFLLYSLVAYIRFYFRMWKGTDNRKYMSGRKKAGIITGITAAALLFLILGAVLPYVNQPEVNEEYRQNLNTDSFYSDEISGDRAMVIKENGEALDERLSLIASARERIILSTFAFQTDEAGKDVLAALLNAAQRGVEVQILADGFNSWLYMEYNPYFYALSSMPNAEIKIYNKVNLLTPWTAMGRMHDKYLIADDNAYILGGRNTFGYFLGEYEGHKNHDWDVLVYNRAGKGSDSSLYQITDYFDSVWNLKVCSMFHDWEKLSDKVSVKKAEQELGQRYERILLEKPEINTLQNYAEKTYPVNKATLISNPTGVYPKEPVAFYTLTELMRGAERNVYIHTPYVLCNEWMYDSFRKIADNVPEFELMTNSAENNGNMFAAGDYLRYKGRLLETGVDIWEYEGGISYHGKCIAIDNDMSIIGSFNMDMRSVYLDTELMLALQGEELNASLRGKMESYEEKAFRVADADSYEEKPNAEKLKMPELKQKLIKAIGVLTGWARFLL